MQIIRVLLAVLVTVACVAASAQQVLTGSFSMSDTTGVFIFVDPNGFGGMPDQYRSIFTNRNLIWIGANKSQRNPDASRKLLKALMAQRVIDRNYAVDLNRLYVGGSGDETYTARNVLLRADKFKGAIYINGSAYWSNGKPETLAYLDAH